MNDVPNKTRPKHKQRMSTVFFRNVPTDVKLAFKAYAAKSNVTMLEAFCIIAKHYAKHNHPLPLT